MTDTAFIKRISIGVAIASTLVLAACGGNTVPSSGNAPANTQSAPAANAPNTTSPTAAGYQPATDVPIPPGTKINTERSVIVGSGDKWVGKMVLILDRQTTQAYSYYQEQMQAFGWEPVTAVQGKTSTLTFVRAERAATVEISPSGLRSSEVAITAGPRQVNGNKK